MRRSALVLSLLFLAASFAGCISVNDSEPTPPPMDDEDPEPAFDPDRVYRIRTDGGAAAGNGTAALGNGTGVDETADEIIANPVYRLSGHAGAEPNMGITSSGAVFATAFSNMLRSQDGGESWEVVHRHQLLNSDPMMWVDTWTDHIYNAPMFPALACASIYRSTDDGETWDTAPSPNCGRNVYDHQKLASGPYGPDENPLLGAATHDSALYVCYNAVTATHCAVSYDDGRTWPHDVPAILHQSDMGTGATSNCGSGQNGHPTVSHQGVVAFGKTWLCDRPYLVYSTDSGFTWQHAAAPDDVGSSMLDPEIAFTPDGTLYMLYRGDDGRTYLLRTRDLGETWAGPWAVSPPKVDGTVFGALGAGDDGRIAFAFLGTTSEAPDPSTAPEDARWHLYMGHSDDAGSDAPTFTTYQVTPDEDPVQIGCVWLRGGNNPCRNMLDFIDGAVHPDGTFYTVYTEGCTEDCADEKDATADESRAQELAIGRLDGFSLYLTSSEAVNATQEVALR